ncbi:MAG TPA: BamA/TamA family outer membrane protein [Candidatus Cloacimonadota bacterium]|nr:BamA/TamA family outer membrane protein [Candidatus Cloacimonadota bacterium]
MKPWLATLCLLFVSLCLPAIRIAEIRMEAESISDPNALIAASGLSVGDEYSPEKVSEAIQSMQRHLSALGEYYVLIPNPELQVISEDQLRLLFRPEILVSGSSTRLHYSGLRHFSASILHDLAYTSAEDEYQLSQLQPIMQRVEDVYHSRGYLFVRVELDSLVLEDGLHAWIRVDEGAQLNPKKYLFRGNKITRESSILKNSGLLGQSPITPAKLQQAEQNLKSKSYINDCRIIPVDSESLLFEISEGRMTYLEGLLGISEEAGKREISGLFNIDFQNLWGSDRAINLYWRSNPNQYSELNLRYHESGLPSLPLAADFTLARSTQDSLWILSSAGCDLYYKSLYQKYGLSFSVQSILPGTSASDVEKSTSQRLGAFWSYQNMTGERIPTSGLEFDAAYKYIINEGPDNGGLEAGAAIYKPLGGRFIAHLAFHLKGYERESVAEHELYRMGGFRTLRGYREDEWRSSRLAWVNSELRYMTGPQSMLYIFYDHGFMQDGNKALKADLFALGAGISIGTKLGIMSLGYGLPYRDKGFANIGLGMVHMGLDIAI